MADGLAADNVGVHYEVSNNYRRSVVDCQNRRKNCLCKSFLVFGLYFQRKQLTPTVKSHCALLYGATVCDNTGTVAVIGIDEVGTTSDAGVGLCNEDVVCPVGSRAQGLAGCDPLWISNQREFYKTDTIHHYRQKLSTNDPQASQMFANILLSLIHI